MKSCALPNAVALLLSSLIMGCGYSTACPPMLSQHLTWMFRNMFEMQMDPENKTHTVNTWGLCMLWRSHPQVKVKKKVSRLNKMFLFNDAYCCCQGCLNWSCWVIECIIVSDSLTTDRRRSCQPVCEHVCEWLLCTISWITRWVITWLRVWIPVGLRACLLIMNSCEWIGSSTDFINKYNQKV